jgi:integration host factor subunit beta
VTKSELIEKVAGKNPHLSVKEVEKIVTVIFDSITNALANDQRVEFRGFGAFSVRKRSPRVAKNPRTGEKVSVEERMIPHFKTGKQLHELLNK